MQPIYYVPQRKSGAGCACCALTLVIISFVTFVVCLSHVNFSDLNEKLTHKLTSKKMTYLREYEEFLQENRKHYLTQEEKKMRYQIWEENYLNLQEAIDSGVYTHELGLSAYHDLTKEEFRNYLGLQSIQPKTGRKTKLNKIKDPKDVDWEKDGFIGPVKNQASCGSCWAFSAIGSTECLYTITNNKNYVSLAEQELVDCSASYGNEGCNGGWMDNGFEYMIDNGIAATVNYTYTARDGKCKKGIDRAFQITGYVDIDENDNMGLYKALNVNAVSVAVDAEDSAFYFYKSGIVMKCGTDLDHGITLVGAGNEGKVNFWRVRNSWSASWGEAGYIRLARDTNKGPGVCGIAMAASYPTLE